MAVAQLLAPYTQDDRFDTLAKRVASFWGGTADQELVWALSLARTVSSDPIADKLYLTHATEDLRYIRTIKEWGYRVAVDYAGSKGSGQRRRGLVEAYRPDWGHAAARDGMAMALWPDLRNDVPGIVKRVEVFHCGKQGYQRVRDEVMRQTGDLIAGFRLDLAEAVEERHSGDFRHRWEMATGNVWR